MARQCSSPAAPAPARSISLCWDGGSQGRGVTSGETRVEDLPLAPGVDLEPEKRVTVRAPPPPILTCRG